MRLPLLLCLAAVAGCASPSRPSLETAADSLAWRITEAAGGLDAWDRLPTLRFDWSVRNDSAELIRTRHLWDKSGDRYRVEWPAGQDSTLVAVFSPSTFDPDAPAGRVALNGDSLTGSAKAERLGDAYGRFINDSYWLLAPLKVLDPGVQRSLAPDSGRGVLAIAFEGVGLTPGDRYWIRTDPDTGAMTGWTYVLEGNGQPTRWEWTGSQTAPGSALRLPVAKVTADRQIVTDVLDAGAADETLFTDLAPRLGGAGR